jgi:hypothetical protein
VLPCFPRYELAACCWMGRAISKPLVEDWRLEKSLRTYDTPLGAARTALA